VEGGVDSVRRDPEYVEGLGRAVYNFAYLEWAIVNIIERLEPGYVHEYVSQKKTTGKVAHDLDKAIRRAKGHAAETPLTDLHKTFVGLKDRRDKLLHASPMTAPDGAPQLRYQAHDIAWDLDTVIKAATKFSQAANAAVHLYYGALGK
jgi:hypothetical protein